MATQTWRNWSREHSARPTVRHEPSDVAGVQACLAAARREGTRVKVVGSGHSWSAIARPEEALLSLRNLRALRHLDEARGLVTVDGGMQLKALNALLHARGFALPVLGSIAEQTLAGATSTGTHGTGARFGNLCTGIESLELVTADGERLTCSERENAALFSAVRCGLGALGVVTGVTMRCVPAFRLECIESVCDYDATLANLDALVDGAEHFKVWWIPHTDRCLVTSLRRTDAPRKRNALRTWFDQRVVRNTLVDLGNRVVARFPSRVPAFNRLLTRLTPEEQRYVDQSHEVFCFPVGTIHAECEYSVPRTDAAAALRALREMLETRDIVASMIVEVRFVAADDLWLSPDHGRASCRIGPLQHSSLPSEPYFRAVEECLDAYGARPHWGKTHFHTHETLRARYPRWDDFQRMRAALDPTRVFDNDYLRRVLGP